MLGLQFPLECGWVRIRGGQGDIVGHIHGCNADRPHDRYNIPEQPQSQIFQSPMLYSQAHRLGWAGEEETKGSTTEGIRPELCAITNHGVVDFAREHFPIVLISAYVVPQRQLADCLHRTEAPRN